MSAFSTYCSSHSAPSTYCTLTKTVVFSRYVYQCGYTDSGWITVNLDGDHVICEKDNDGLFSFLFIETGVDGNPLSRALTYSAANAKVVKKALTQQLKISNLPYK